MNELNEFNTGGSHQSNPYGGIPMGENQFGQIQSVQQGETMFNIEGEDFIFSTNYKLNQQDISDYNLPKTLVGLDMSEATKKINKMFDDRYDSVSSKTKNEFLKRIAEAQEVKKIEEQSLIDTLSMNNNDGYVDLEEEPSLDGLPLEGMIEPDYSQIPEEQPMDNQVMFAGGGFLGMGANATMDQRRNGYGMMGNMFGNIGNIIGSKNAIGEPEDNAMVDGVKDTVAQATGPFGQMFRGIQKAGQGIGNMIGGEGGAAVSGLFSPEEATIANWKDDDLNVGQKLLGTIPGVGGIIAHRSKKKKIDNIISNNAYQANNQFRDKEQFADGGFMRKQQQAIPLMPQSTTVNNGFQPLNIIPQFSTDRPRSGTNSYITTPTPSGRTTVNPFSQPIQINPKPQQFQNSSNNTSNFLKGFRPDTNNLMRTAPILNNFLQLKNQRKPIRQAPIVDTTRAQRRYMDNESLRRGVETMNNNSIAAINQMGGSTGARRAAILGSNLQRTRALSEADIQTQAINRQVDDRADMLDAQTRAENLRREEIANENFAKDVGAYDTNRSALQNTLYNSIGNIGLENRNEKTVGRMYGYDSQGNYLQGGDSTATRSDVSSNTPSQPINTDNQDLSRMLQNALDYQKLSEAMGWNKSKTEEKKVEESKVEESKPSVKKKSTVKKTTSPSSGKPTDKINRDVSRNPYLKDNKNKNKKVDVMNNPYGLNAWKRLLIDTKK